MTRNYPLKKYQIWIGNYHLGQGDHGSDKPEMLDEIEAINFKVACLLYELKRKKDYIEKMMSNDEYLDHQSCRWFYNFEENSNSWTGRYFETKEDAWGSFNESQRERFYEN